MTESIALRNRVEHSHERIDALEKRFPEPVAALPLVTDLLARIEKLEGEIRAMKARMGKVKETA